MTESTGRLHNIGRIIIAVYAIMALSATARSLFQIIRMFELAPLAITLSTVSGIVYIVATVALATRHRRLATWAISFELVGVIVVGSLSLIVPAWFPISTVWSEFGIGYACFPLVMPVVGLWWLRATETAATRSGATD